MCTVCHDVYYDRHGQPITLSRWAILQADPGYRVLKKDRLPIYSGGGGGGGGSGRFPLTISTIWTGLDLRERGEGPPMIYETLVLGGAKDRYSRRYVSEAEAMDGHERVVEAVLEMGKRRRMRVDSRAGDSRD